MLILHGETNDRLTRTKLTNLQQVRSISDRLAILQTAMKIWHAHKTTKSPGRRDPRPFLSLDKVREARAAILFPPQTPVAQDNRRHNKPPHFEDHSLDSNLAGLEEQVQDSASHINKPHSDRLLDSFQSTVESLVNHYNPPQPSSKQSSTRHRSSSNWSPPSTATKPPPSRRARATRPPNNNRHDSNLFAEESDDEIASELESTPDAIAPLQVSEPIAFDRLLTQEEKNQLNQLCHPVICCG